MRQQPAPTPAPRPALTPAPTPASTLRRQHRRQHYTTISTPTPPPTPALLSTPTPTPMWWRLPGRRRGRLLGRHAQHQQVLRASALHPVSLLHDSGARRSSSMGGQRSAPPPCSLSPLAASSLLQFFGRPPSLTACAPCPPRPCAAGFGQALRCTPCHYISSSLVWVPVRTLAEGWFAHAQVCRSSLSSLSLFLSVFSPPPLALRAAQIP